MTLSFHFYYFQDAGLLEGCLYFIYLFKIFTSLTHILTLVSSRTYQACFGVPKMAESKPRWPAWATLLSQLRLPALVQGHWGCSTGPFVPKSLPWDTAFGRGSPLTHAGTLRLGGETPQGKSYSLVAPLWSTGLGSKCSPSLRQGCPRRRAIYMWSVTFSRGLPPVPCLSTTLNIS